MHAYDKNESLVSHIGQILLWLRSWLFTDTILAPLAGSNKLQLFQTVRLSIISSQIISDLHFMQPWIISRVLQDLALVLLTVIGTMDYQIVYSIVFCYINIILKIYLGSIWCDLGVRVLTNILDVIFF